MTELWSLAGRRALSVPLCLAGPDWVNSSDLGSLPAPRPLGALAHQKLKMVCVGKASPCAHTC